MRGARRVAGGRAAAPIQERLDRVKADLYSRTDRLDENVKELKQILALDPRSADAHMLLGIAYSTWGSKELKGEAIGEFRQALDLNPRLVQVRFFLAHLYLDLGRAVRAREELEAALAQTPGNPEFLALLGEAERQLKNPRRAVEVTRQALQADPLVRAGAVLPGPGPARRRSARRRHQGAGAGRARAARRAPTRILPSGPRTSMRAAPRKRSRR